MVNQLNSSKLVLIIALSIIALGAILYFHNNPLSSSKVEPLSTSGKPMPETDVPITLPPDPGEAGKKTLAGIDSNNDGVRDDLEREIVYMYPKNDEVRRVLRAMVKRGQDVITTEGDHDHFEKLMVEYFTFENCYELIVNGYVNANRDSTKTLILWNMIRNTTERKTIFEKNDTKGKPYGVSVTPSCDPVKDKY